MHKVTKIPTFLGVLSVGIIAFWIISLLGGLTDRWFSYGDISIKAQDHGDSELLSFLMCYVLCWISFYMWQVEKRNLALTLLLMGVFYNPFFNINLGRYDEDLYPLIDVISLITLGQVIIRYTSRAKFKKVATHCYLTIIIN